MPGCLMNRPGCLKKITQISVIKNVTKIFIIKKLNLINFKHVKIVNNFLKFLMFVSFCY